MSIKAKKVTLVEDIEQIYTASNSVIFTHYHGLTVSQLSNLRKTLTQSNAKFKIVKNTLSKIAANKSSISLDQDFISGPVAIAYTKGDASTLAKAIIDFSKTNKALKVVGAVVNNKVFNKANVEKLSELPSLDVLRGKIVGLVQASSTKLVTILSAPGAQLARLLNAYSKK
jgi:large subunit ribosomal protein L10